MNSEDDPDGAHAGGGLVTSTIAEHGTSVLVTGTSLLSTQVVRGSVDNGRNHRQQHQGEGESGEHEGESYSEWSSMLNSGDTGEAVGGGGGGGPTHFGNESLDLLTSINPPGARAGADRGAGGNGANNNLYGDESLDRALAKTLQEKFDISFVQHSQRESEETMRSTSTGKALHFTKLVLANHDHMMAQFFAQAEALGAANPSHHFSLVNADDLVFLAERVFALQEEFAAAGKDVKVDIGYHYTHSANMERIRTDGLLTNKERQANSIRSANGFNGSVFGDGIYTGENPFSYHNFGDGDQGLLVARLKGNAQVSSKENDPNKTAASNNPISDANVNTVLGRAGDTDQVTVLKSSSQCVALVQYKSNFVDVKHDDSLGNKMVYEYHRSIQRVVDESFNDTPTEIRTYLPSQVTMRSLVTGASALQRNTTTISQTLDQMILYTAPEFVKEEFFILNERALMLDLVVDPPLTADCVICRRSLTGKNSGPVGRLPRCYHEFHASCMPLFWRRHSRKCPCCATPIGNLQGQLGDTTLWADPKKNPGALVVHYKSLNAETTQQQQQRPRNESPHGRWPSYHVTYVPHTNTSTDRGAVNPAKFTFACGSTFDMAFSRLGNNGRNVALNWQGVFDNAVILKRIQKAAVKHCKKCSPCRKAITSKSQPLVPIGLMPTGTMRVDEVADLSLDGHTPGAFVLTYKFENGALLSYHENPGDQYAGTFRTAYIPSDEAGQMLLKRLKFAFVRGLTFSVGTSLTTQIPNSIIWNVAHKTSLKGGKFGFPDTRYFQTVHRELDELGIPSADSL